VECSYGCGREAKYFLKNGNPCCSERFQLCPEPIRKSANTRIGQKRSKETKKLLSEIHKGHKSNKKGKTYIELYGKEKADKIKKKMSINSKVSIEQIQKRYPFFSRIEEMRYNPNKTKEIQVHCKNHNCPNSKEQGGWFTPTYNQLSERIRQLENDWGNCSSYFYCSKECKNICPLYGKTVNQLLKEYEINDDNLEIYTSEEYQIFRQEVLKRDDYKCIYCGEKAEHVHHIRPQKLEPFFSKAEHVHHIRPQKLEPFFSLDPDFGISVCINCHFLYGHKTNTNCSTNNLAKKVC